MKPSNASHQSQHEIRPIHHNLAQKQRVDVWAWRHREDDENAQQQRSKLKGRNEGQTATSQKKREMMNHKCVTAISWRHWNVMWRHVIIIGQLLWRRHDNVTAQLESDVSRVGVGSFSSVWSEGVLTMANLAQVTRHVNVSNYKMSVWQDSPRRFDNHNPATTTLVTRTSRATTLLTPSTSTCSSQVHQSQ